MKRPSFQFYPEDWLNDLKLRQCKPISRALWIDMLCWMHQGEPYGHLRTSAGDLGPEFFSRVSGLSLRQTKTALHDLCLHDVFSRTSNGTIFSRRMVRDEKLRNDRAEGGYKSLENPNVPRPKGLGMSGVHQEGYPSTRPSTHPSGGSFGRSPPSPSPSPSPKREEHMLKAGALSARPPGDGDSGTDSSSSPITGEFRADLVRELFDAYVKATGRDAEYTLTTEREDLIRRRLADCRKLLIPGIAQQKGIEPPTPEQETAWLKGCWTSALAGLLADDRDRLRDLESAFGSFEHFSAFFWRYWERRYGRVAPLKRFEEWWATYPRKVGKNQAERAYKKQIGESLDRHGQLMTNTRERNRVEWGPMLESGEAQFIPHPTTYLNQGRWKEPPEAQSRRSNQGTLTEAELIRQCEQEDSATP